MFIAKSLTDPLYVEMEPLCTPWLVFTCTKTMGTTRALYTHTTSVPAYTLCSSYVTYYTYHYSRFGISLSINRQITNFEFWIKADHVAYHIPYARHYILLFIRNCSCLTTSKMRKNRPETVSAAQSNNLLG